MSITSNTAAVAGEELPLRPGDRFGDFAIDRLLGRGGMGAVYLAHSPDGLQFAIKIMYPGKMTHDLRVRFAREAEFAMNIRHENLISVYDVGEDPDTGLCYIIMDYVGGGTLSGLLKERGRLPVGEAVDIAAHVARALAVAHGRGLVHRDVKPDNIMFMSDGVPKLADLGVAKFDDDRATMVTRTNMVIGTPAYMSPEQLIDSHNIDLRSDIYSLGIVLYEMLSGQRPNSGSTAVELLAKAIKGDPIPDVRTVCEDVPAPVAYALSVICAPTADGRPATAIEAADLLERAAAGTLEVPKSAFAASASNEGRQAQSQDRGRKFAFFALVAAGFLTVISAVVVGWALNKNAPKTVQGTVPEPGTDPISDGDSPHEIGGQTPVDVGTDPTEGTVPETGTVPTAGVGTDPVVETRQVPRSPEGEQCAKVGSYAWYYTVENGEAVIGRTGYDGRRAAVEPSPDSRLVVPATLDGFKVAKIGANAFYGCERLESVDISTGVREIRAWSFQNCEKLKNVGIPSSLESIEDSAFVNCPSLATLDIGKCRRMTGGAFVKCPGLAAVSVSEDNPVFASAFGGALYTKDFQTLVFYPRTAKETVRLSRTPEEIGDHAFETCDAVAAIVLPGSVKKIGIGAFSMCSNLSSVDFGGGVVEVGDSAFSACERLVEVEFPASLRKLGGALFAGCRSLTKVTFLGNAPETSGSSNGGILRNSPEELVVSVAYGTRGWKTPGSPELPDTWPIGALADSRPIRFMDDARGTSQESGASSRHFSVTDLQRAFRAKGGGRMFIEVGHGLSTGEFENPRFSMARFYSLMAKVDVVSVVLGRTKDGVLYSVCDGDLRDVSNGSGNASRYTSGEFEMFRVRRRGMPSVEPFARVEDMLRRGKGYVMLRVSYDWRTREAVEVAKSLTRLMESLDAWESVILDLGDMNVARARDSLFSGGAWDRIRTGELQVIVSQNVAKEWAGPVPECIVAARSRDRRQSGLGFEGVGIAGLRIAADAGGGPIRARWTDDKEGWSRAMRDGVRMFRTARPLALGAFISNGAERKLYSSP